MQFRALGALIALAAYVVTGEPATISFVWPTQGDTLFVGDTVTIRYEINQSYLNSMPGIEPEFSINAGEEWHDLPLVDTQGFPVVSDLQLSGEFRVRIPATVTVSRLGQPPVTVGTATDDAALRMHPYQISQPEAFVYDIVILDRPAEVSPHLLQKPRSSVAIGLPALNCPLRLDGRLGSARRMSVSCVLCSGRRVIRTD